jgi:hypothetical protein
VTAAHSRPLRVVELATGGEARDLSRRHVLVTADGELTASPALRLVVTNLRRLPVTLHVTGLPDDVAAELVRSCAGISPGMELQLTAPDGQPDLHVHVGRSEPFADISGIPIGHGVRLRRRGSAMAADDRQASGLGHVFTAATLTAEAFKDLLDLDSSRARRLTELDFCPVSLSSSYAAVETAPALSDTTLVGGGAIGTAIALILRELRATGALTVVDPETFSEENLGAYSLGTIDDAHTKTDKVELVKRALPRITTTTVKATAIEYLQQLEHGAGDWPKLILGAVDSVPARYEIARLHADLTLDGSTGGKAGTTFSLAEARHDGPCLRCFFPKNASGPSVEQRISEFTGLTIERLARGDEPLVDADLEHLAPEQRERLRAQIGKPVCGLARDLGFVSDFAPSVVFVAQAAAALVVGAMLRRQCNPELTVRDVEYDALFGPTPSSVDTRRADAACVCQRESAFISEVRRQRGQT